MIMSDLIGGIIEVIIELLFEVIIPALNEKSKIEERKARSMVAVAVAIPYLVMLAMGAIFIYNNPHNVRWIMYGITMVVSAALIILVTILRAKGFKYSFIYSLNFIVIVIVTSFTQIDINLFLRDKKYYILLLVLSILVCIAAAVITVLRIIKYNRFDKKVKKYIVEGKFYDERINEIEKLKTATNDGILSYYNLVNGHLDGVDKVKDEIPATMYFALKNNFKRLDDGKGVISSDDVMIKMYKDNMTRYIYRLAFTELKRKGDK